MKPRLKDRPDPAAFGRGLGQGLGINLLVSEMAAAIAFQTGALEAEIVWQEAEFAIMQGCGATWMLHADRAYRDHPLGRAVAGLVARGGSVELRLYGCDPDRAAARAEAAGGSVLCAPLDKPHGLREAFLLDPDGYAWVPSLPTAEPSGSSPSELPAQERRA